MLALPEHAEEKLIELAEHYGVERDMLALKYLVDVIVGCHEENILAPKRRQEAS